MKQQTATTITTTKHWPTILYNKTDAVRYFMLYTSSLHNNKYTDKLIDKQSASSQEASKHTSYIYANLTKLHNR